MTGEPSLRRDAETILGTLFFGLGMGIFAILLSSSGVGFFIGFIAGLFLAGGLDLIVRSTRP